MILQKAKTPDLIDLVLVDTNGSLSIRAYPIAKNTGRYGWVRKNETFCLTISEGFGKNPVSNEQITEWFNNLANGNITLTDLSEYYWYGQKDQFYMGLAEKEF